MVELLGSLFYCCTFNGWAGKFRSYSLKFNNFSFFKDYHSLSNYGKHYQLKWLLTIGMVLKQNKLNLNLNEIDILRDYVY